MSKLITIIEQLQKLRGETSESEDELFKKYTNSIKEDKKDDEMRYCKEWNREAGKALGINEAIDLLIIEARQELEEN